MGALKAIDPEVWGRALNTWPLWAGIAAALVFLIGFVRPIALAWLARKKE